MATENPLSTEDSASNGGEVSSPQSRRRGLSSPWASVVRGDLEQNSLPAAAAVPASSLSPPPEPSSGSDIPVADSSVAEAHLESADVNGDANAGRPRRPVWNRPVNGAPEPATVMGGAVSWPALSETTRLVPRSSTEGSRPVSDGSASSSQAPIISQPPQRPSNNNNNTYSNPTGNSSTPSRPRRNRGGGSSSVSGTSQNAFNQHPLPMPPPPPPFHVFETPFGMVPPVLDPPVRGPRPVGGVGGSHSHVGNDHSQRNNPRRGGYGQQRARGDGTPSNNHGGRRDQERRDVHRPPHYLPSHLGYMAAPLPPGAGPFIPPPPVRVFPGQMGFDTSPFIYVPAMSMPMVPPPPPYYPPPDPITSMIVKQIDFYFSDDNLAKDKFLRSKMDEQGWVSITVIAAFRRIDQLTKDIPLILDSLRYSAVVEVQDGKVRRRSEWRKYLPPPGLVIPDSNPSTSTASDKEVAASIEEASLNDSTSSSAVSARVHTEMTTGLDLSQSLSSLAVGEGTTAPEENRSISV